MTRRTEGYFVHSQPWEECWFCNGEEQKGGRWVVRKGEGRMRTGVAFPTFPNAALFLWDTSSFLHRIHFYELRVFRVLRKLNKLVSCFVIGIVWTTWEGKKSSFISSGFVELVIVPLSFCKTCGACRGLFRSKSPGTFCPCKWMGWGMASPQHANDLGVAFVQFFAGCGVWDLFWGWVARKV